LSNLVSLFVCRLEKFVNLNFTGFHKILKKHDRRLPNPCKAFYTARLHDQSWVRGDFSDVIVSMSRVYSALRGDEAVEAKDDAKQNFVRSTRKYWVHTENISAIKYTVLQHLPVFLQDTMAGKSDSQLVNSVYLDNTAMELYHGRLDKTPGAIALRFRWYGTGTPETVFVERKTHRESWAGEVSVKERFIIKETQVASLLNGTFDLDGEVAKLQAKGKSEEAIREWFELASEVVQAINSKQLVPTMRTQYMRTAFQIPFDATVRVSLDTNLCMISERTKETMSGERWFRDPNTAVPLNEITRFPHAVLEVKLQLLDADKTPQWVNDMLASGSLLEVHKFSKFIHGGAVLMPEDVRSVPYWIDDVTLAESISQSGSAHLLQKSTGANEYYQHLLPHDKDGKVKYSGGGDKSGGHGSSSAPVLALEAADGEVSSGAHGFGFLNRLLPSSKPRATPSTSELADSSTLSAAASIQIQQYITSNNNGSGGGDEQGASSALSSNGVVMQRGGEANGGGGGDDSCCGLGDCFEWTRPMAVAHMTTQKVEPKLFFANERTFISWLHMAVVLSTVAIGILANTKETGVCLLYIAYIYCRSIACFLFLS
jgi:SPX domain protein involved in polyphosphate accumulation